jgi:hypothetical protein
MLDVLFDNTLALAIGGALRNRQNNQDMHKLHPG